MNMDNSCGRVRSERFRLGLGDRRVDRRRRDGEEQRALEGLYMCMASPPACMENG